MDENRLPHITLYRFLKREDGVFGFMACGTFSCFTVEKPDLGNIPYESCIPEGLYKLSLGYYHRGNYPAYVIKDVPGRTDIKIHAANDPEELFGCIAPNEILKSLGGKVVGANSKHTLKAFMEVVDSDEAWLLIT